MIKRFVYRIITISIIAFSLYFISFVSQADDLSFQKSIFENLNDVLYETRILNRCHNLLVDILITLWHFFPSFILSSIAAIALGILTTQNETIQSISDYFIDFLRVLPSIVYITLFAYVLNIKKLQTLIFNDGIEYIYFVVFISSFWAVIISTKDGINHVNETSKRAISQLNLGLKDKMIKFTLPEAFPEIFNGIKISLGIAFLIAITCEFITPRLYGLGALLHEYEENEGYIVHSIIVIVVIGILGLTLTSILDLFEKKLPWLANQYKTIENTIENDGI